MHLNHTFETRFLQLMQNMAFSFAAIAKNLGRIAKVMEAQPPPPPIVPVPTSFTLRVGAPTQE